VFSCFDIAFARNVHHHGQPTGLRNGKIFLNSQTSDLRATIATVLGEGHNIHHGHLDTIRRQIEPTWNSLATNEHGRIDKRSLRFAVHRYFMQLYSLSIVGLEPTHTESNAREVLLLSEVVPNYVHSELEGKASQNGFTLDDAVIMVATIERLVADTSHEALESVYRTYSHQFAELFPRTKAHRILELYMIRWMLGDDTEGISELEANNSLLLESVEDWPEISAFLSGQMQAFEYSRQTLQPSGRLHHWSAFSPRYSMADIDAVIGSVTMCALK